MALQLEYRGGSYFISEEELNDTSITEISAYFDEEMKHLAEVDGGHLVFKKEQMDETTMASSAGAYVPALTGGIVRRKFDVGRDYDMKQSDENEVVKGFELKKPIGKIFSLGLKEGEEEVIKSQGYISEYTAAINDALGKLRRGDFVKMMRGEEVMVDLVPTHEGRGFPNKFKYIPSMPSAVHSFSFERVDGDKYKVKGNTVDDAELKVGMEVEMEHTDSPEEAKKIAMDHIKEDPKYYSKLLKADLVDEPKALKVAKEVGMMSESLSISDVIKNKVKTMMSETTVRKHIPDDDSMDGKAWADLNGDGWYWNDKPEIPGGEIINLFPTFTKKELNSLAGRKNLQEQQVEETTTAASGAAGAYVGPAMWAKNRRNWRMAAKPTWKNGAFVKFKEKCVKYNNKKWCSQGAIDNPISLVSTLMEAAYKLSEETGKDMDYITQLITKKYSVPNEHVTDSVIELAKASGYDMFSGVGQTEFTKDIDGNTEYEITVDGVTGDIHAMVHNIGDDTFSGKTFDSFEDAIDYLENI